MSVDETLMCSFQASVFFHLLVPFLEFSNLQELDELSSALSSDRSSNVPQ